MGERWEAHPKRNIRKKAKRNPFAHIESKEK